MKRSEISAAQARVRRLLENSGLVLGPALPVEVVDFGLGRWEKEGLGLVVRVNEPEYCSKYLTLEPGQKCPLHFHKFKKEIFFVLVGTVALEVDGHETTLTPGRQHTLEPGTRHTFSSSTGAVIEEVSTHDENSDSYFADAAIVRDPVIEED